MPKSKNILLSVLIFISAGVFIISAIKLITIYHEYNEGTRIYNEIRKYAETAEPEYNYSDTKGQAAKEADTQYLNLSIDFAALSKKNPDITAWIHIPAIDISYPVVQGNDNDYYLHHMFNRQANITGSIFMDYRSTPDFTDDNTFIYGHNMKNGSMFGSIDVYSNEQFQKQHPYFYIYIPGYVLKYHIISCITKAASDIDYRMNNNEDSKTVTLSTCDNDNRNYRCLIEGRLVSESPCQ